MKAAAGMRPAAFPNSWRFTRTENYVNILSSGRGGVRPCQTAATTEAYLGGTQMKKMLKRIVLVCLAAALALPPVFASDALGRAL